MKVQKVSVTRDMHVLSLTKVEFEAFLDEDEMNALSASSYGTTGELKLVLISKLPAKKEIMKPSLTKIKKDMTYMINGKKVSEKKYGEQYEKIAIEKGLHNINEQDIGNFRNLITTKKKKDDETDYGAMIRHTYPSLATASTSCGSSFTINATDISRYDDE